MRKAYGKTIAKPQETLGEVKENFFPHVSMENNTEHPSCRAKSIKFIMYTMFWKVSAEQPTKNMQKATQSYKSMINTYISSYMSSNSFFIFFIVFRMFFRAHLEDVSTDHPSWRNFLADCARAGGCFFESAS